VPAPADGVSRFIPCAWAKPVPAISAAAAVVIIKRLNIKISPQVFVCCMADNERRWAMFPEIRGSIDFVLCDFVLCDFVL
jgi:hypothetical protein